MQPNMHCKVDGKLFAAITEWQKIDISLALRAGFPGLTLKSGSTFSAPAVPTKFVLMYQICTRMTVKGGWKNLWKAMYFKQKN
jgi:hypothetical protein